VLNVHVTNQLMLYFCYHQFLVVIELLLGYCLFYYSCYEVWG
jgi:hypothetical protein